MSERNRRSFLTGSALFAAALLAAAAGARDEKPKQNEKEKSNPEGGAKEEEDPFAEEDKAPKQELKDAEGRTYRVCPQCGSNMYRQGRTWTCENCGYSYVE